ncbi:hypothetical protein RSOL_464320 [Rhizoctonia solani AG-3 Rhs1AP]|uniref:Uncharacterized protein n=2 Tax=Rhizoctonia solani AG-3 TaxID=1086053 RepID=X8JIX2_9AGAM|nr:hypothetical protein RSOL_464320 [Rhizoctonia solani AG-3 Rhs1AP]
MVSGQVGKQVLCWVSNSKIQRRSLLLSSIGLDEPKMTCIRLLYLQTCFSPLLLSKSTSCRAVRTLLLLVLVQ